MADFFEIIVAFDLESLIYDSQKYRIIITVSKPFIPMKSKWH
jgi:hypothetical protein